MRVLHVINSLATGGAEKLLVDTVPLYNKRGVPTDVLLLKGTATPFFKTLQAKVCCRIFSLTQKSVYHPLLIFKIIPYLKKYDVVHVHLFPALYFVALAKWLSFSKTKLVFTEHSTSNRRMEKPFFRWLDQWIYARYDLVIAISEPVKKSIQKQVKLPEEAVVLIPNGIDLGAIQCITPNPDFYTPAAKEHIILLQVASFQPPKDQATLIRALTFLPPSFELLLVGEGVNRQKLAALVDTLQLQKRVHFLGLRNDIPQLLQAVDYVVLSSKYEGLSLASIEGMASGKPVIAANVPGLKEVVAGAGLLFEYGDAEALAALLLTLAADPEWAQKIAQQCQARAAQFDIETMIVHQIQRYAQLVKT